MHRVYHGLPEIVKILLRHYNSNYSDDPLYGPRILAASKDPIMKQALWQFEKWPPKATGEG